MIILLFSLQSCGKKENTNILPHKIVLGAFFDVNYSLLLNLKELNGLPKTIDLKSDMTEIKSQGTRASCTFFATMALVEAAVKKNLKREMNFSEEYLNYQTKKEGYYPNKEESSLKNNFEVLKKSGLLLENVWPYQSSWFANGMPCSQYKKSDTTAPAKCFSHNSPSKETMEKLISSDAFELDSDLHDINQVIKFLALEKRPVAAALVVNHKGWPDSGDVFYNENLRSECLKNESLCGSHMVIITGYDFDKKIFYFKNSWGKDWGNEGYGTVTFETFDRYSVRNYYSVKLKGLFNIIQNTNEDVNLEFKNFTVTHRLEKDRTLSIETNNEIDGEGNANFYIESYLVKISKENMYVPITHSEANAVKFGDRYVRNSYYFNLYFPQIKGFVPDIDSVRLSISAEMMNTFEVTSLLDNPNEKLFLATSLFQFSDTGSKMIKKLYQPL